jgi:hypothetical protein
LLLAAKRETAEDKEARQQARPPDAPADAGEAPTAAASPVLLDPEPNKAAAGNPATEPEAIAATPEDGKELSEESPRQSEPSPKSPPAHRPNSRHSRRRRRSFPAASSTPKITSCPTRRNRGRSRRSGLPRSRHGGVTRVAKQKGIPCNGSSKYARRPRRRQHADSADLHTQRSDMIVRIIPR